MKNLTVFVIVFLVVIASGCRKAIGLGPYYPELVGVWKNSGESTKLTFRVNGKIHRKIDSDRESSFKAVSVQQYSNGDPSIVTLQFRDKKHKELLEIEYNTITKKLTFFNLDSLEMD